MDENIQVTVGLGVSSLSCLVYSVFLHFYNSSSKSQSLWSIRSVPFRIICIGILQVVAQISADSHAWALALLLIVLLPLESHRKTNEKLPSAEDDKPAEQSASKKWRFVYDYGPIISSVISSLGLVISSSNLILALITGIVLVASGYVLVGSRSQMHSSTDKHDSTSLLTTNYVRRIFLIWLLIVCIMVYLSGFSFAVLPSSILGMLQIAGLLDSISRAYIVPAITMLGLVQTVGSIVLSGTKEEAIFLTLAGLAMMSKTRGITFLTSKVGPRLLLLVVLPTIGLIVVNAIERAATPLHPIEYLHQRHSKIFQAKLARQSRSLPEAVKEYRRRNHRHPPPGFGVWYSIARKHKFELIDEFDTIMSNINPLWQVPPTILRSRLQSARDSMLRLDFGNGQVNKTSDSYHGVSVERWLEPFFRAGVFSEVSFLINELDEPRIIPVNFDPVREEDFKAHADTTISNSRREKHVVWHNLGQHPWIIPQYRTKSTSLHSVNHKPTMPPFVTSLRNARDFRKTSDLLTDHGFYVAPASLHVTNLRFPVLSQGAPPYFGDILYPSPYYPDAYKNDRNGGYDPEAEPVWKHKLDVLYWSGSSTGMYNELGTWYHGQRARLGLMFRGDHIDTSEVDSKTSTMATFLEEIRLGPLRYWRPVKRPLSIISKLLHISVTRVVQCTEEACAAMSRAFNKDGVSTDDKLKLKRDERTELRDETAEAVHARLRASNAKLVDDVSSFSDDELHGDDTASINVETLDDDETFSMEDEVLHDHEIVDDDLVLNADGTFSHGDTSDEEQLSTSNGEQFDIEETFFPDETFTEDETLDVEPFDLDDTFDEEQVDFGDDAAESNKDTAPHAPEPEPMSAGFTSKYVFDMDGNGFSGRYYRLLRSKACVLKATIFNEWHDDRLEPWVHYLPVSMSLEEVPEMMRFLTQDRRGRGDKLGSEVAQAGKLWAAKVLRERDMAIVMAVIAMELERVMSDARNEMNFGEHHF